MNPRIVRNARFSILAAILLAAGCATQQAPQETAAPAKGLNLYAPASGATVPTLSDGQKAYLMLSREERVKKFASQAFRNEMKALGYYPKPIELAWSNATASAKSPAQYTVELRQSGGKAHFPAALHVRQRLRHAIIPLGTGAHSTARGLGRGLFHMLDQRVPSAAGRAFAHPLRGLVAAVRAKIDRLLFHVVFSKYSVNVAASTQTSFF